MESHCAWLSCNVQGHAECQQFMMTFGLPMLVLGGGGYRINNVARCWAYETGRILGAPCLKSWPMCQYALHGFPYPDACPDFIRMRVLDNMSPF